MCTAHGKEDMPERRAVLERRLQFIGLPAHGDERALHAPDSFVIGVAILFQVIEERSQVKDFAYA